MCWLNCQLDLKPEHMLAWLHGNTTVSFATRLQKPLPKVGIAAWTPSIMEWECLGSHLSSRGWYLWFIPSHAEGITLLSSFAVSSWSVMLSTFSCACSLYVSLFFYSAQNSSTLLNEIKKSTFPVLFFSLEEIFNFPPFSIKLTTPLSYIAFILKYVFFLFLV